MPSNNSLLKRASASVLRSRLSKLWLPTSKNYPAVESVSLERLLRAGFVRQSHPGIFHLLPLGLRVQDKLERLLDRHMQSLGASRVSLSSITSEQLWRNSGRFKDMATEVFKFCDRRSTGLLLAPTHEEEITTIVSKDVKSYKELPLRLYQITRKYRDEQRPRQGLMRSREFVMKDLYSFDISVAKALETYRLVGKVYSDFFADLKLPCLVAEASSAGMGGNLSHEYLLPSPTGEDSVITCDSCDYIANEEVAEKFTPPSELEPKLTSPEDMQLWRGISIDRKLLVDVWYPLSHNHQDKTSPTTLHSTLSIHALKKALPALDTSVEDATGLRNDVIWQTQESGSQKAIKHLIIIDHRIAHQSISDIYSPESKQIDPGPSFEHTPISSIDGKPLDLLKIHDGDSCGRCKTGRLRVQKALELGHTFHLGTRYSEPLGARVKVPLKMLNTEHEDTSSGHEKSVALEMGCHGIGVSRIMGALAESISSQQRFSWPSKIAPFQIAILVGPGLYEDACIVHDNLAAFAVGGQQETDIVIDDRQVSLPWKMKDAELIGFPVVIIVGREWKEKGMCEVRCSRSGIKKVLPLDDLGSYAMNLL